MKSRGDIVMNKSELTDYIDLIESLEERARNQMSKEAQVVADLMGRIRSRIMVLSRARLKKDQLVQVGRRVNLNKSPEELGISDEAAAAKELAGIANANFSRASSRFNRAVRKLPTDAREEAIFAMSGVSAWANNEHFERGVPTLEFFESGKEILERIKAALAAIKGHKHTRRIGS